MYLHRKHFFIVSILISLPLLLLGSIALHAQTADTSQSPDAQALRQRILEHNKQLLQLDQEIKQYQSNLDEVGKEKQSLQSTLKTLDISRSKVSTDIKATETKIATTDLTIQELEQQIRDKESKIERNSVAIALAIQKIDELESNSLLENLLMGDSITDVWDNIASLTSFQSSLGDQMREFSNTKKSYEQSKTEEANKKEELNGLKGELSDRKKVLDGTRTEKNQLLSTTKEKESNYQKMLAQKKQERERFEKELLDYESQLKFVLDRSTIPSVGASVLTWPFEASYFADCPTFASALGNPKCITQYFGNTPFAKSGAYNGSGHNGIDFRAPIGTKITAALSGEVIGTGNTDAVPNCYSFGKWVMIRHNNGISTLYAHLSTISISAGAHVETGQAIGYSGVTGYVTGPHLHFGVYASNGVKIQKLSDIPGRPITGCSPASIPVAGLEAYLNPLDYLPK